MRDFWIIYIITEQVICGLGQWYYFSLPILDLAHINKAVLIMVNNYMAPEALSLPGPLDHVTGELNIVFRGFRNSGWVVMQ